MRTLVIAPSALAAAAPPADWQDQVLATPGVQLVGRTGGQLQVQADDAAHQAIVDRLGEGFNVEEAAPRGFAP
jgi:hypothetical protein